MAEPVKPPQSDPKAGDAPKRRGDDKKAAGAAAEPAFSGAVEIAQDAGKAEATLLSAHALRLAARQVRQAVAAVYPAQDDADTRLFIQVGEAETSFDALIALRVGVQLIEAGLGPGAMALDKTAQDAHVARGKPAGRGVGHDRVVPRGATGALGLLSLPALGGALTAATQPVATAVQAVVGLGAMFQSDYALGGVTVAPREALLGAAVAGELASLAPGRVLLPGRAAPAAGPAEALADLLTPAANLSVEAAGRLAVLHPRLAAAKAILAAGAATPPTATQVQVTAADAVAKACEEAIGAWERLILAFDGLLEGLARPGADGTTAMARAASQYALARLMRDHDLLLCLQLGGAMGGYVVKRNIFTVLTGFPVTAMGGVVASYTLVRRHTGAVLCAGVVPTSSGYVKLTEVDEALSGVRRRRWWARLIDAVGRRFGRAHRGDHLPPSAEGSLAPGQG